MSQFLRWQHAAQFALSVFLKFDHGSWQVGAYLEERINAGINFVLSAELDHYKKDYKFGFGMVVGE